MIPVVPAIIPENYDSLRETIQSLQFAHEIQIDVVDGKFVAPVSWPFQPAGSPKEIKPYTDAHTLEVDLMVAEPVAAAKAWEAAGADMLVFHVESIPLTVLEHFVEQTNVTVGVACSGNTTMDTFISYVRVADYVQLMGITEIGKQGQPFDATVIDKIRMIKEAFPEKMISIDGAVNEKTIQQLAAAGADRFVAGSAILGAHSPEEAYRDLVELVN